MIPAAERAEAAAMRSWSAAAREGRVAEIGGATACAYLPTPGSAMFNRVLALGLAEPATAETLAAIAGFYAEAGTEYCIALAPEAQPADLPARLEERGFVRGYAWTKFVRDASPAAPSPTELRIERTNDGDAFADVVVRAYGAPDVLRPVLAGLPALEGWSCYLALADDEAVAAAAVHVDGDAAWLGVAGTLPEARGRGAQSALLAARIEEAGAAGCTTLVTETGAPVGGEPGGSYRNIVRAGFEAVYVRENYLSSPSADTSGTQA
jgi:GNAT superfamily N-acetyltransferase